MLVFNPLGAALILDWCTRLVVWVVADSQHRMHHTHHMRTQLTLSISATSAHCAHAQHLC